MKASVFLLLASLTASSAFAQVQDSDGPGNLNSISISKTYLNPKYKTLNGYGDVLWKSIILCESDADAVCRSLRGGGSVAVDMTCKSKRLDRPVAKAVKEFIDDLEDTIFCNPTNPCSFMREQHSGKDVVVIDENDRAYDHRDREERAEVITKIVCQ